MNLRSLRTNSESVHCDCVEVACVMGNGSSTMARLIAVPALVSIMCAPSRLVGELLHCPKPWSGE